MAGVQPLNARSSTTTDRATARKAARRRAHRRRNLTVVVVMLVALALLIGGAWKLVLPMFHDSADDPVTDFPGPGSGEVTVVLEDADPTAIGTALTDAGVVATVEAFVEAYEAEPRASGIVTGTYSLTAQMRAVDAVAALLDPGNRVDRTLTIPPGWRTDQIVAKISEVMGVPATEVREALAAVDLPAEAGDEVEGWLFAAVYTIGPEETVTAVVQRMVDRTVEMLDEHAVAVSDRESVLVQASIVEAEVSDVDDRGKVARVLVNRLAECADVGPLLQMNSTLAYGLGKAVTDLTVEDTRDESTPFNTYVFEGLPPTPINSPSIASIEAVLDPPEGTWCYFVTVNLETGETLFTDDPAEHEENKAKYREWLEQWREEQSAGAESPTAQESEG